MGAEIELQGLDELLNRLRNTSEKISTVENRALKDAAEPVAAEMKSLVHVSNLQHLHIRDDIQISGVKTKEGLKQIEIGPGRKTNWRAKFLEWGTSKMQAIPFVQPAFEHKKREVMEIMAESIRKALKP